jgi:hypothetical protein
MRAGRATASKPAPALDLTRFVFVLPEPIALPDGFDVGVAVSNPGEESAPDDPLVWLVFRQVRTSIGRTDGVLEAITTATAPTSPAVPSRNLSELSRVGANFTVVEATTPTASPDSVPSADHGHPARWLPRAEPLTRCLSLVRDVVRAYRQATEAPIGLPEYVRIPSPVLEFTARGRANVEMFDGVPYTFFEPTEPWTGPKLVMLDHWNGADPIDGREYNDEIASRFRHWFTESLRGNPMNLARERFIEARRSHEVMGDEGQAVILANTATEVFIDTLLALLVWDEGAAPWDAAPRFEEGKSLRRLRQDLGTRLRFGPTLPKDLVTDAGPVGDWFRSAYKVRHRVVHAGYSPTRTEARNAIDAALGLETYLLDRLADVRTTYKRSTLLALGEVGLTKRGLWNGQIRRYSHEHQAEADTDRLSYIRFYRAVMDALIDVE